MNKKTNKIDIMLPLQKIKSRKLTKSELIIELWSSVLQFVNILQKDFQHTNLYVWLNVPQGDEGIGQIYKISHPNIRGGLWKQKKCNNSQHNFYIHFYIFEIKYFQNRGGGGAV